MLHGYVIRTDRGTFVAYPGGNSSYTRDILNARRFATREHAQAECCGNERVVSIDSLFGH